jgi:hypothetical protein
MEIQWYGRITRSGRYIDPGEELQRQLERNRAQALAEERAEEAMLTIVETMRTTTDDNVKLKCALAIIERAYGKPKQIAESGCSGGSIVDVLAQMHAQLE